MIMVNTNPIRPAKTPRTVARTAAGLSEDTARTAIDIEGTAAEEEVDIGIIDVCSIVRRKSKPPNLNNSTNTERSKLG